MTLPTQSQRSKLTLVPMTLQGANLLVSMLHRHHKPVVGHKFSIGVESEGTGLRGIIIIGRPVSRHMDNGWTLEVTRCCTDGAPNACSMLYGAAWRATKALGYRRLITYTLATEGGSSLKAAGWKVIRETAGGSWSRENRPRTDKHPTCQKLLWEAA